MNILFAFEDDMSSSLKNQFKENKYTLEFVNDGLSAIDAIVNSQPDVLVIDLILPKLDGFGVLNYVNTKLVAKKPLVIVTSSLTQDAFVNKAMKLGASDFLARPFDADSLKNHIEMLLEGDVAPVKPAKSKAKILEEQITNVFLSIGIPAHIKGYQFLKEAIKLAFENPSYINNITKELYPAIAQRFETSASKVERAIRHAIEIAWNRGKIESINTIFGVKIYDSSDRPTNSEFIALVADKMLLENA